jgi:hypothetical protein
MERSKPKLPSAARRDINTSDNVVEEEQSLSNGIIEMSSATNALCSSRVRSPSPKVVNYKDMNWKRSNNLAELDVLPIKMTVAGLDHLKGLVAIYPISKIRQF